MPETEGVLFDYGRTLVTFTKYPKDCIRGVLHDLLPGSDAEAILQDVLLPLESYVSSTSLDEVDYEVVYRNAWRRAGNELSDDFLHDVLDREQTCWDRSVRVDPDGRDALEWLGMRGIKRGICSNAPFPPSMMRRQLERNGISELVDGVVFSSEVGRRKPAPELYLAALDAIGARPEHTLFVGDRVREDYEGPVGLGMRAVIVTAHAEEAPADGVPTVRSLAEIASLL